MVVAATGLISAGRVSATARRVDGRRRDLSTLRAGLFFCDQAASLGMPVQPAQRNDKVLSRAAPAAGVAARYRVRADVCHELLDL